MRKIIIAFSIICILMTTAFMQTAYASAPITLDDWDDYIAGATSGSNGLVTWSVISEDTDNGVYFGNTMVSSPNSLLVGKRDDNDPITCNSTCNIDLVSNYSYIGSVNIPFKYHSHLGAMNPSNAYIYFYDGSKIVMDVRFHMETNLNTISFRDLTGSYHILKSHANGVFPTDNSLLDCWLNISHYNTNLCNVTLWLDGTGYTNNYSYYNGTMYMGGVGGISYDTFNRIQILDNHTTATSGHRIFYFDDIIIDTTASSTSTSYCDLTNYSTICSGDLNRPVFCSIPETSRIVETEFQFYSSDTIYAVVLPISNDQYNQVSSTKSDYTLDINGVNCGNPDYIIPIGYHYGLQWCNLSVTLTNDKPLFKFYCGASVTYGSGTDATTYYWFGIGQNPTPNPICRSTFHDVITKLHVPSFWGFFFLQDTFYYDQEDIISGTPGGCVRMCYYYTPNVATDTGAIIPPDLLTDMKDAYGNSAKNDTFIEWWGLNIECYFTVGDHPIIAYYITDEYLDSTCNQYIYYIRNSDNTIVHSGYLSLVDSNRSEIKTISDYIFTQAGQYRLEVYNATNYCDDAGTLLDNSLPITVCGGYDGSNGGGNVLPFIAQPLGSIIGMMITIFCTFLPLMITGALHINVTSIPAVAYALTCSMGIGISTVLGLFPFWLPLFILAVGIIVIVIYYLLNNNGSGEN